MNVKKSRGYLTFMGKKIRNLGRIKGFLGGIMGFKGEKRVIGAKS